MIVSRLKERRKLHRHREQFISTPAAKSDVRRAALTRKDGSSLDLRPDVSWVKATGGEGTHSRHFSWKGTGWNFWQQWFSGEVVIFESGKGNNVRWNLSFI